MDKIFKKIMAILCVVLVLTTTIGANNVWAKKYNIGNGKTITLKGKVEKHVYKHWNGMKENVYILKLKKKATFVSAGTKVKTKEIQMSLSNKQYKKLKKKKNAKVRGMVFLTDYEFNNQWVRRIGMLDVKIK